MNKLYIIPFIVFIGLIFFTPSFGSYDIIGPQWLLYSILNITLFFFLIKHISLLSINGFLRPIYVKLLSFFFFLCFLSLLYANNKFLVIHDLSRFGTFFLSIFLFYLLFQKGFLTLKQIYISFIFISCIEVYLSLQPLLLDYFFNDLDIFNLSEIKLSIFKGNAGNKNIIAASIVTKLPLSLYLLSRKNISFKIFASSFLFFQCLAIFLLSARASFLSFSISILLFTLYLIYMLFKSHKHILFSLPLLILSISLSFLLSSKILPSNLSVSSRSSSINFSNESSSNRLELWSNALDHIIANPFLGSGFGNWKVESIKYWGNIGDYYLIPYHAHNDILELSTELGILGGLLYLSFFLLLILYIAKMFFKTKSIVYLLSLLYLLNYSIDMLLNFPLERPIMQLPLALFSAFFVYNFNSKSYLND